MDECELENVPEWLAECIWFFSEWDSHVGKSMSDFKWGIDPDKDNSIDAHYNNIALEIRNEFELGLNSVGVSLPYQNNLSLLLRTRNLMRKKISAPENVKIKGKLIVLLNSFGQDFNDCFAVLDEQEREGATDLDLEPEVIKGNPKTIDKWILWKLKQKNLDPTKPLPYRTQALLIKDMADFGYADDSALKRRWKSLGLSSRKR